MKKILALMLALCMVFALCACGSKPAPAATEAPAASEAPVEEVEEAEEAEIEYAAVDYEGFVAAELDSAVAVTAFVQSVAYNAEYGNASLFLADEAGHGYYVYRMNVTEEEAAQLVEGACITVCGFKSEWSGEVEIIDASFVVAEGEFVAEAADVTELLGTDDLAQYINAKVAFTGMTVEDAGEGAAFLYNWDGSGEAGANCDLYFNVSINGETYIFTVESDECPEGSEVYDAVTALQVGDVINVEGFMYWYEGPQTHVQAITAA